MNRTFFFSTLLIISYHTQTKMSIEEKKSSEKIYLSNKKNKNVNTSNSFVQIKYNGYAGNQFLTINTLMVFAILTMVFAGF